MEQNKINKTFCIIATNGHSLLNFRSRLIVDIVNKGYRVVCVSIEPEEEMIDKVKELGAEYFQVSGDRTSTGLFSGFKMISKYKSLFKKINPDVTLLFMSKPIAFGGTAARLVKLKNYNILVNGMENAYYQHRFKDFIVRLVMSTLYRFVCAKANSVIFQNHDDMNYFISHKMLKKNNASVVGGSGVDMNRFKKTVLPNEPVILMTSRLLWSKGIREYLDATAKVKEKCPEVKIMLVGGLDESDEALTKEELDQYIQKSDIEYCGFADDVRPYLEKCSIFVLPSYHEGLPRSVCEAMAVGRPIIVTDVPGCRETVIETENGLLVPVMDSDALANSIIELVNNPRKRELMANNSFEICKEKFDINIVNHYMMEEMCIG